MYEIDFNNLRDHLCTLKEMSALTGIPLITLQKWCKNGVIKAYNFGIWIIPRHLSVEKTGKHTISESNAEKIRRYHALLNIKTGEKND